jgi:hypothetical protein
VRAEQRCEVYLVEALVLEELEQVGGWRVDVGEETVWCGRLRVLAPDVSLYAWATGTGDDGVVAGEDCSV